MCIIAYSLIIIIQASIVALFLAVFRQALYMYYSLIIIAPTILSEKPLICVKMSCQRGEIQVLLLKGNVCFEITVGEITARRACASSWGRQCLVYCLIVLISCCLLLCMSLLYAQSAY